jgi:hypothetical protein
MMVDEPVEYKSTTGKAVQGAYTGISVQPTWEEQEYICAKRRLRSTQNIFIIALRLESSWKAGSWWG